MGSKPLWRKVEEKEEVKASKNTALLYGIRTGLLEYTALKSSTFSFQGTAIMSVRMAEEVSTQVPADDFQALEDKVYRTIELYKSAREARSMAERDLKRLREQLEVREEEVESLRREMVSLRKEREEIRARVEKMLTQIDRMGEEPAAS
jgi:chromosome segregation ATPase